MLETNLADFLAWAADEASKNWVSIVAAVISVASAISAASHKRTELKIAWTKDVVAWANDSMLALAEGWVEVGRTRHSDDVVASDRRADVRARLAASVDRGRLFFENREGSRPDVLDPLVRAFDLLTAAEEATSRYTQEHLVSCMSRHRSDFWRVVQATVDPAWVRKVAGGPDSALGAGATDFDRDRSVA